MNILESIGGRTRRELLTVVRMRQIAFLGHVIKADGLEYLGRIAGNRSRGRPRKKYLDQMKEVIGGGVTTQQLLNMTKDHEQWKSITGNVYSCSPDR